MTIELLNITKYYEDSPLLDNLDIKFHPNKISCLLGRSGSGKTTILKINIDQNNATPGKYNIMSIPTTVLFKKGKEIGRQVGFGGKKAFEDLIKSATVG